MPSLLVLFFEPGREIGSCLGIARRDAPTTPRRRDQPQLVGNSQLSQVFAPSAVRPPTRGAQMAMACGRQDPLGNLVSIECAHLFECKCVKMVLTLGLTPVAGPGASRTRPGTFSTGLCLEKDLGRFPFYRAYLLQKGPHLIVSHGAGSSISF